MSVFNVTFCPSVYDTSCCTSNPCVFTITNNMKIVQTVQADINNPNIIIPFQADSLVITSSTCVIQVAETSNQVSMMRSINMKKKNIQPLVIQRGSNSLRVELNWNSTIATSSLQSLLCQINYPQVNFFANVQLSMSISHLRYLLTQYTFPTLLQSYQISMCCFFIIIIYQDMTSVCNSPRDSCKISDVYLTQICQ